MDIIRYVTNNWRRFTLAATCPVAMSLLVVGYREIYYPVKVPPQVPTLEKINYDFKHFFLPLLVFVGIGVILASWYGVRHRKTHWLRQRRQQQQRQQLAQQQQRQDQELEDEPVQSNIPVLRSSPALHQFFE